MENVLLICDNTGPEEQEFCQEGYSLEVRRNVGKPLSEMELRSMLTQTIWAIEGEKSMVVVQRGH